MSNKKKGSFWQSQSLSNKNNLSSMPYMFDKEAQLEGRAIENFMGVPSSSSHELPNEVADVCAELLLILIDLESSS